MYHFCHTEDTFLSILQWLFLSLMELSKEVILQRIFNTKHTMSFQTICNQELDSQPNSMHEKIPFQVARKAMQEFHSWFNAGVLHQASGQQVPSSISGPLSRPLFVGHASSKEKQEEHVPEDLHPLLLWPKSSSGQSSLAIPIWSRTSLKSPHSTLPMPLSVVRCARPGFSASVHLRWLKNHSSLW